MEEKVKIEFKSISNPDRKAKICKQIINNLPAWFGNEEAKKNYIEGVKGKFFLAAFNQMKPVGFISLKEHNQYTEEIYVLGILKKYQRQGIGKRFLARVEENLLTKEKKFLIVKTLGPTNPDEFYKKTRKFYRKMGFYPLEEMIEFWDEENPCLFMVKLLGKRE